MKNLYIFDCFGVVVSDVSNIWMRKHFDEQTQEKIRRDVFRKVDCGVITFDQTFDILSRFCGMPKDAVRAEWNGCMSLLTDTVALINRLRKLGGTVVLLSNASEEYIEELFTQYNLFGCFDKIFVSAHYGCAKPDEEFYKICLESFSEKFDNVYFTDDNPKNLVGLEKLGIKPLLFTSAEKLKKDLDIS